MTAPAALPGATALYDNRAARPRLGAGLAILSSSFFGVTSLCARLAFEHGADAPTANLARYGFALVIGALLYSSIRGGASLPLRARLAGLLAGALLFLTSFGYFGALQYIPVSIAVLLIYTYPLLVALIERIAGRERLGPWRVAALLLGFAGLVCALDPWSAASPDPRGVALAAIGGVGMALMVTISARLLRHADSRIVNLHILLGAFVLFLVNLALAGGPAWPQGSLGWAGFGGQMVAYSLGQFLFIAAIARAGAVLAAAVMNFEPLITIGLAVALLGERPTLVQGLGAALVLSSILLLRQWEMIARALRRRAG
jgi:drug/metabolite transporter (DMT)-like permease